MHSLYIDVTWALSECTTQISMYMYMHVLVLGKIGYYQQRARAKSIL